MNRRTLSTIAVIAASLLIATYVAVAETGPIGWVNYAQQSIFGAYSRNATLLVLMVAGAAVLGAVWFVVERIAAGLGVAQALPSPRALLAKANGPVTQRGVAIACVVILALVWAGGYAGFWWIEHEHGQDVAAHYEPVELVRGGAAPGADHPYLALRGRLLFDKTVALTQGSSSEPEYRLVPLVEPQWREGDPVWFVAKVDRSNRYLVERPSTRSGGFLLAHSEGAIPVPATQEFRKMQVPISDGTSLLRLVPSEDGKPALRDSSAGDWQVYLILAGIGTALTIVFGATIILATRLRERRLRRH